MKHLKIFENFQEPPKFKVKPEVGDYVLIDIQNKKYVKEYSDFIQNNIGRVTKVRNNLSTGYSNLVDVAYDIFSPKNEYIRKYFTNPQSSSGKSFDDYRIDVKTFNIINISALSKNKKDLQILLDAKKYNL